MIYRGDPTLFEPDIACIGCYLEYRDRILMLQKRDDHPFYPGQWGVVAGKMRGSEREREALKRECAEETGNIVEAHHFDYLKDYLVVHPHLRFSYSLYRLNLSNGLPEIRLSSEHQAYSWVKPIHALDLDLIPDEVDVIREIYCLK
jgi:8-oxo-dGTP pyrophosphatase MutT (NUDIX family)